jgi:hypothetical protein
MECDSNNGDKFNPVAMAKKTRNVSAETIVREIDKIFETAKFYQSRESGKRFYNVPKFSPLLSSYISQGGDTIKENAYQFGMSAGWLKKLLDGGPLSENMLVRIRSALNAKVVAAAKGSTFPGNWCDVSPKAINAAIFEVSEKLVFLKQVIAHSNSLQSENPVIDKIQISQLIALLTATLEALRAPFVDTKQTQGFFKWLVRFAKHAVKKGAEKVVVEAMEDAATAGTHLVHHLSSQSGLSDLANILK